MNKRTIIDTWLNNFSDVGFTGGSYNSAREQIAKYFETHLDSKQVTEIENLHLWENIKTPWTSETFKLKLKELGYL